MGNDELIESFSIIPSVARSALEEHSQRRSMRGMYTTEGQLRRASVRRRTQISSMDAALPAVSARRPGRSMAKTGSSSTECSTACASLTAVSTLPLEKPAGARSSPGPPSAQRSKRGRWTAARAGMVDVAARRAASA